MILNVNIQLNNTDQIKFHALTDTFNSNFRAASLWQKYLENCPDLADPDMVSKLCKECRLNDREAICRIVAAAFDLDEFGADRSFYKTYIEKAIKKMDPNQYIKNPYYQNIHFPNVTSGAWELKTETYPPFRLFTSDDLFVCDGYTEIPQIGFFDVPFSFPAVLENGNEWMTLSPVDLDTSDEAIRAAHGNVVTFGLGLGYYAYRVSEKKEVQSVTVVEKSPDVIKLFQTYLLPQFSNQSKIHIVKADAFEYAKQQLSEKHFDIAFVDTWRDASDGLDMYIRMKCLERYSPNTVFYYWIEEFLLSGLRHMIWDSIQIYKNAPELRAIKSDIISVPEITSFDEIYHMLSKKELRRTAALIRKT